MSFLEEPGFGCALQVCFLAVFIVKCWLGLLKAVQKSLGGGGGGAGVEEIGGLGEASAGFQEVR